MKSSTGCGRWERGEIEVVKVGDSRMSQTVILPGRFKRAYIEEGNGIVFFCGKDIAELERAN